MNAEQWRLLGRLESRFEENQQDVSRAIDLAEFLKGLPEGRGALLNFLAQIQQKFPGSFKIAEISYRSYKEMGDKEKAAQFEKILLDIKPEDLQDLRRKLLIFKEKDQPDKASEEIESYEKDKGRTVETLWMAGDLYATTDNQEKLLKVIEDLKVLKDQPNAEIAIAALTMATKGEKKENWEEAQKLITQSLKKDPSNMLAYRVFFLGSAKLAPSAESIHKVLDASIKANITEPFIFVEIMRLHLEYTIPLHNKEIFEKLIVLLSEAEKPVINTIHALCCYFDNIGLARNVMRTWLDPQGDGPNLSIFLAQINTDLISSVESGVGISLSDDKSKLEELKKILKENAISCMQRLITQVPTNPDAYYQMGLLLQGFKDERAYQYYIKALEIKPDHVFAQFQVAKINDDEQNDIEAYERYRKIVNMPVIDPNVAVEAMMRASDIAIKYGWVEEAEEMLERARAVLPSDPRVVTMLAKIYLKEAKIIGSDYALEQAMKYFMQAISINPRNMEASYYLGHVFYINRQYLDAIRQFNDTAQKFQTVSILCDFWISRSYHQLYKNLLFSSEDFLTSAIKYAEYLRVMGEKVPEALEYLAELYEEANRKNESQALVSSIQGRLRKRDFVAMDSDNPGECRVLAVYAPQIVRSPDPARPPERLFSRGSLGTLEVSYIPGGGGLLVTGNLGESFQNSIEVAYAFFKKHLENHGLVQNPDMDIHVDVPGWLPKYDGPSAGVALACSMISAFTGKKIPKNVTMTGEISMHGKVMPVGGIKEKVEATYGKGIDKIFIPKENKWDYLDMLLKDTTHEMESVEASQEEVGKNLPIVIAVDRIEQIIENLGIGVDESMIPKENTQEEPEK
ncbi:MAG: hypothetical protein KBC08_06065 [Caldisericia bacterium]|nr:hypothetical protein [Caldisericia bacterium]